MDNKQNSVGCEGTSAAVYPQNAQNSKSATFSLEDFLLLLCLKHPHIAA